MNKSYSAAVASASTLLLDGDAAAAANAIRPVQWQAKQRLLRQMICYCYNHRHRRL